MSAGHKSDQCLALNIGRAEADGSDLNRLGADGGVDEQQSVTT
jgi:hypothetical protein